MTDVALTSLSITELSTLLSKGEVSPVEVTNAYLSLIEQLDSELNAYITLAAEPALAAARMAEETIRTGHYLGPLHGVPVAVKDLFLVNGLPRTCGASIMGDQVARRDATSVARLRAAGAIILGSLNLHEFAYGPTGINPHHGTARNPWNPTRVCGGSSSGSGCAVAASLAAATLGTDTGGSIRIPAALCGVVGLKQTYGLASRDGIYPLSEELDHGGPLAKTVADAAVMLQAIAGEDRNDPSTRGVAVPDYIAGLGSGLEGVRIGVPGNFFFDDLHAEVEAAVRDALIVLQGLGAEVIPVEVPFAEPATEGWTAMAVTESFLVHEKHLQENGDALSPDVESRLRLGRDTSAETLVRALWIRTDVNRQMMHLLEEIDLLATPTAPIPAVRIADGAIEMDGQTVEGAKVLGRLTRLAAFTGQPAVSVPCGFTTDGLPVGLQLIGAWFDDSRVLAVAHAYEQATSWHRCRPPEGSNLPPQQ